jgi:hypothetical protein
MNSLTNLQFLTQTSFDSGSLSGTGAVVHRIDQPGDHQMTVLQADKAIQTASLRVAGIQPRAAAQAAPSLSAPTEVHVDLSHALGSPGVLSPEPPANLVVAAQGYAMFHASTAGGGLAVQLHLSGAQNQPPIFDSRQLHNSDIFTVTLLRPGRYSLSNAGTAAKGTIQVSYPVISDTPYSPPAPLEVQVTEKGFQPASIQLQPAQGLIFHIGNVTARILINLVEPDDGPKGADSTPGARRGPLHQWQKPAPPETKPSAG